MDHKSLHKLLTRPTAVSRIINSGEDWLILELLKAAYPDMERQGIEAWLYENHYPERTDLVSDEMFDQKILALVEQAKIR